MLYPLSYGDPPSLVRDNKEYVSSTVMCDLNEGSV